MALLPTAPPRRSPAQQSLDDAAPPYFLRSTPSPHKPIHHPRALAIPRGRTHPIRPAPVSREKQEGRANRFPGDNADSSAWSTRPTTPHGNPGARPTVDQDGVTFAAQGPVRLGRCTRGGCAYWSSMPSQSFGMLFPPTTVFACTQCFRLQTSDGCS